MSSPRSSRRATIKDVAKFAGVSTQTVSRVLNDRPDVSAETRQRIQKIIVELGYKPSELARSLIQQRSNTLGIIIAGLRYVGVSLTLNGITEAAEAAGYSLLLKELPRFNLTDVGPPLHDLFARHVDGILYAAPQVGDNWQHVLDALPEPHPPVVFLKGEPQAGFTTISIDNYNGARLATAYLLAAGRRHIGHLAGPQEWWEARQRLAGWQAALREAGLQPQPSHWVAGNWSSSSGESAYKILLDQYPEMDAVFAANDQMALAILNTAQQAGMRIPQDLAVIGFDDLAEAAYFNPPLTTVRQDLHQLGWLAVQKLLEKVEMMTESSPVEAITLQPELVVRQSTP
jgi:DNA-binding LacI/PurR family transcriptional regulator